MSQLALGVGLGISSMLLGFAFGSKGDFVTEVKWWELLTALGTLGAVVAAVSLGLADGRRRRRQGLLRAQLTALKITPLIAILGGDVSSVVNVLNDGSSGEIRVASLLRAAEKLASTRHFFSISDAEALIEAPQRCAQKLASVIAHHHALIIMLEAPILGDRSAKMYLYSSEALVAYLKDLLEICSSAENWC